MCETLPVDMLARLSALGAALAAWARRHRDATLAEQEVAVLAAVRQALPDLLGAVVQLSTTSLDPGVARVRHRCPACDRRRPVHSWRARRVRTVCGTITVTRPWYYCRPCRRGYSPVDATLALAPGAQVSEEFGTWLVRLGATTTFRAAAALLRTLTGLEIAADSVREHSTTCGTTVAAAQDRAIAQVVASQAAAGPVEPAPGTLVVEADGVLIRYRDGWHEVKVGLVGGCVDGALKAVTYVAAREPAERFGPRLLAEAARRGALDVIGWEGPLGGHNLAVLRPVHVLGDGAPWIWNLAADHFGTRTEVVDFYHASEHLWDVARALHGTGTTAAAAWADARIGELYEEGVAPTRAARATARAPTTDAAEVLRVERGYFATNAARMDYPAIRDQGLPIGSGAVESCARHVVQHRMKRPGQRWSDRGGRAIVALRACFASGRAPRDVVKHQH